MLADKAYPTWTAEQHQEVVSNQFIQGVKFQVVREMPATLDQELARGLQSVELAQSAQALSVTDPAGEAISDTH